MQLLSIGRKQCHSDSGSKQKIIVRNEISNASQIKGQGASTDAHMKSWQHLTWGSQLSKHLPLMQRQPSLRCSVWMNDMKQSWEVPFSVINAIVVFNNKAVCLTYKGTHRKPFNLLLGLFLSFFLKSSHITLSIVNLASRFFKCIVATMSCGRLHLEARVACEF